jgi:hypothetical protein
MPNECEADVRPHVLGLSRLHHRDHLGRLQGDLPGRVLVGGTLVGGSTAMTIYIVS